MKKRINKKGFTLIELMVVVGVLGVLMAIAIPAYNGIEARAYQTVCETNERNYVTAWSMYRIVHNNVIDTTTAAVTDPETLFKEDTTNGVQYFDANKFPQCPAGGTYAVAISTDTTVPTATFTCDVHDA